MDTNEPSLSLALRLQPHLCLFATVEHVLLSIGGIDSQWIEYCKRVVRVAFERASFTCLLRTSLLIMWTGTRICHCNLFCAKAFDVKWTPFEVERSRLKVDATNIDFRRPCRRIQSSVFTRAFAMLQSAGVETAALRQSMAIVDTGRSSHAHRAYPWICPRQVRRVHGEHRTSSDCSLVLDSTSFST